MLLLGFVHLLYTFRGVKLHPRDSDLTSKMMAVSPAISSETTMWRAWVGFNISHSLCLILFGAIYGYLAIRHSTFLFHSSFLLAVGAVVLVAYAILAKVYWFSAPFRAIVLSAVLCVVGFTLRGTL